MTEHQPFLASRSLRRALSTIASIQQVAAGETIIRQDEPVRGIYLICSGTVALSNNSSRWTKNAGRGSALGLPAVMGKHRYILTAQAVGDAQLAFVPYQQLVEILDQRPDLCLEIAKMLGTELHYAQRTILSLLGNTTLGSAMPGRKRTAMFRKSTLNPGIGLERARHLLAELKLAYSQLSRESQSAVREQLTNWAGCVPARN